MESSSIHDLVSQYEEKVEILKEITPKLSTLRKREETLKKEIGIISSKIHDLTKNFKTRLSDKKIVQSFNFYEIFDLFYKSLDNGTFGSTGWVSAHTISKNNCRIYRAERIRGTKTMPTTDEYYVLCYKHNSYYYPIKAYNINKRTFINLYIGYFSGNSSVTNQNNNTWNFKEKLNNENL